MTPPPPVELTPQGGTPIWNCWNCCFPPWKQPESSKATNVLPRPRPFPHPSGTGKHHKELSLILEETESKLRLELESDVSASKRSFGSSITSTSAATSTGDAPQDLLLCPCSTDLADNNDSNDHHQHLLVRGGGEGTAGSSTALLELAWRVMVSIIFLSWFRKRQDPSLTQEEFQTEEESSSTEPPVGSLSPPPSPSSRHVEEQQQTPQFRER